MVESGPPNKRLKLPEGWSWLSNEENDMRRYEQVSGAFFCLLAVVQLARVTLRWPVQVAGVAVPLWASVLAFLLASAFAIWAFRAAKGVA